MGHLKELQSRPKAALTVLLIVPAFLLASGCSSGSNNGQALASTDPSMLSQSGTLDPSNLQIQVSPTLTPSFDPSIHDYVINCTTAPEVQFTAWMPNALRFGFFGPGDRSSSQLPNLVGSFRKSLALRPGQRFRFVAGRALSEYSVRCLPEDFPPLSVSLGGIREAEWYLFAPALAFNPTAKTTSYVIISDANGTPIWWKNESAGSALDAKILGTNQIAWTVQTNQPDAQYVIRNFFGQVINTVGSDLNDHDLQPTPHGTFLAIRDAARTCPPDCADMSPWGGSSQMSVLDQEIVELDKGSTVLWTWRTRDHVALSESGASGWFPGVGYDIIHMNAVEPDGTDGVLFSALSITSPKVLALSTGKSAGQRDRSRSWLLEISGRRRMVRAGNP